MTFISRRKTQISEILLNFFAQKPGKNLNDKLFQEKRSLEKSSGHVEYILQSKKPQI